jgi:lycopene elongase/hydratase (dihydrobisanhydrobacterioruberin-forming)
MPSFLRSPYILHLRPKVWPTVAAHVFAGAFMALGPDAFMPPILWRTLLGCIVWTAFLNGGTLAFNSAFDKDEGDIAFLHSPPPIPRGLMGLSSALMIAGALLSLFLGPHYFTVYCISLIMSWIYSAPPIRLKARGGWDVLINGIGYGALTALAGWYAVRSDLSFAQSLIFVGFGFLFAAFYPMTQFYQREDDRKSGARTLVLVLGDRLSMIFIHVCLILTVACWLGALIGMRSGNANFHPWAIWAIAIPSLAWLLFAMHWWATFDRYPHRTGMYRACALWGFTNVCLALAFYYGFA